MNKSLPKKVSSIHEQGLLSDADSAQSVIHWPHASEVGEYIKNAFIAELEAAQVTACLGIKKAKSKWPSAVFYTGVSAAWQVTGDQDYRDALERWCKSVSWQPGPRFRHADDLTCGQVYLEFYQCEGGYERIVPIRERVDSLIAANRPGRRDWWWCDSLFMAPPVFVRLSQATGQARYREVLPSLYWDAMQALWDEQEHLFYRDWRYVCKPTKLPWPRGNHFVLAHGLVHRLFGNSRKVFWSRGNGWVLAGLARILMALPADEPSRARYEQLFKMLAARILQLQHRDGAWRTDLVDSEKLPAPESSGTALFAYAFAWGVNNGLLSPAEYAPAVVKAWRALKLALLPNNRLGCVQPVGFQPAEVEFTNCAPFGTGAFLLLGSELLLSLNHRHRSN